MKNEGILTGKAKLLECIDIFHRHSSQSRWHIFWWQWKNVLQNYDGETSTKFLEPRIDVTLFSRHCCCCHSDSRWGRISACREMETLWKLSKEANWKFLLNLITKKAKTSSENFSDIDAEYANESLIKFEIIIRFSRNYFQTTWILVSHLKLLLRFSWNPLSKAPFASSYAKHEDIQFIIKFHLFLSLK